MRKKGWIPVSLRILTLLAYSFFPSCVSMPSLEQDAFPDVAAPLEEPPFSLQGDGIGEEAQARMEKDGEQPPPADMEPDDAPQVWGRAEETLAYADTPVNPDFPEPLYVFPEPAAELAVEENPPSTGEAQADEPVAAALPVQAEETAEEEPPPPPGPPAALRPPQAAPAPPPPREPVPVPPAPLPPRPARVPPSETWGILAQQKDTPPGRVIRAVMGENAEVPFPGTGWIYLGEVDEQKGLPYQRRRMSADGLVFVFRPEASGSYQLAFKKQDLVRGTESDEVVTVIVTEKARTEEPAAAVFTDPPPDPGTTPAETDDLETAETTAGDAEPDSVPGDTALWNRARELETAGPNRDMKGALAAYKTLLQEYPQSEYYTESQKRIAYIERFFVNIR
jgi:hypothetical protein